MWETPQDVKHKWAIIRPVLERHAVDGKSILDVTIVVVNGLPLVVQGMPLLTVRKKALEPRKIETGTNAWWQPIRRIQSTCSGFTGMIEVSIGVSSGLPIFWSKPERLQIEMS